MDFVVSSLEKLVRIGNIDSFCCKYFCGVCLHDRPLTVYVPMLLKQEAIVDTAEISCQSHFLQLFYKLEEKS